MNSADEQQRREMNVGGMDVEMLAACVFSNFAASGSKSINHIG